MISDYFLNKDNFGKVHAEGDHKIHVAKVMKDDLVLDSSSISTTPPSQPGLRVHMG